MFDKLKQKIHSWPPIAQYIAIPLALTLLIGLGIAVLGFAFFSLIGVYSKLENALDLKASSPWIKVPLYAAMIGAVSSFLAGFLMYVHKYKRPKPTGRFHKSFAAVMKDEQTEHEGKG